MNHGKFKDFLVLNEDGSFNHEASCKNFERGLKEYVKNAYVNKDAIRAKITEIFDKSPGITINKFKVYLLAKMNVNPANIEYMEEAISEVVNDMSGDYESGAELCTFRGLQGGTFRWKDAGPRKIELSIQKSKEVAEKKAISDKKREAKKLLKQAEKAQ